MLIRFTTGQLTNGVATLKEIKEELFALMKEFDALCITTNGIVRDDGMAVMGKGVALQCKKLWPETPRILGSLLPYGNIPYQLGYVNKAGEFQTNVIVESGFMCRIFSFPTKHDWRDKSDLDLIKQSSQYMVRYANELKLEMIAMSQPGCQNGGLSWEKDVRPVLSKILDDRFYIVSTAKN